VSDAQLTVTVNGEARTAPSGSTVQVLLASLGLEQKRIAVAVNRDVVPRSTYDAHELAAGDRIEILEAVGGG
jgi:thiamine biosynthesis protein ThiS